MAPSAAIFGVWSEELSADEAAFLRAADPWGFILFARNISDPKQLRRLTSDLRETVGRDAPILIDQEGGRVQRMSSPYWRRYLPALDQMARARQPMRAQWVRNRLIAHELHEVGIDVNCAPLADLVEDETHPILKNRLYGSDVVTVVEAARTAAEAFLAFLAGGVLPVLKHIPGYGRARVDGHLDLPRVTASREALMARDFAPFYALRKMKMGMTAHIVMEAIDPDLPATVSPAVMQVIREDIGFDGLMMTDDISMEALSGSPGERSVAALAAGCDLVLHSSGYMPHMEEIAAAIRPMDAAAVRRAEAALAERRVPQAIDIPALDAELEALLTAE